MAKRNPPWSRDELIIALDVYIKHQPRLPSPSDPIIVETSQILNQIAGTLGAQYQNFRNANAVYMKLANFQRLDSAYTSQGKRGLSRGGKGDAEVWDDFAAKPDELAHIAATIKSAASNQAAETESIEAEAGIAEAPEGRLLTRLHVSRERNRKLVEQKKKLALKVHGALRCEVCSFDFVQEYGDRGRGFIEAHHVKPLHTLSVGARTRLEDLALVCANCHRMIHARRPWLTIGELKAITTPKS